MPKVLTLTPAWLQRPAPGATIFSDPEPQSPVSPSKRSPALGSQGGSSSEAQASSTRLIACRGSEIFTVVGTKLRWSDLSHIKREWDEQVDKKQGLVHDQEGRRATRSAYRTLLTPVFYQITKLAISPSGDFLAICTEHTVHVALLPASSRLDDEDQSPLKLKTFQLGPTIHVLPEAPLVSVLWHPLATSTSATDCLVTVTSEAAVRVWELDRSNRWSFERPSLAVDLRKLADGTSCDQDFEPVGFGKTKGFSVDAFDMEVAAACFGGQGTEDEGPWASMTLWTAMTNGDVYALCPLLPSKWRPTPTTIPALTISAVSRMAEIESQEIEVDARRAANQQYEWVQEIDSEEPFVASSTDEEADTVYYRPQVPSAIPRLQGPFQCSLDDSDVDAEITDIHVIAPRLDEEALLSGEEDYDLVAGSNGLPFSVVCLVGTDRRLHMFLELEGVSGQWLPQKGRSTFSAPASEVADLVELERWDLRLGGPDTAQPLFTHDPIRPYEFFVTSGDEVFSLSLTDWASRVGTEASGPDEVDSGLHTRLALACRGKIAIKMIILSSWKEESRAQDLPTAVVKMDHVHLGSWVLTRAGTHAAAAQLDSFVPNASQTNVPTSSSSSKSPFRLSQSAQKMFAQDEFVNVQPVPTRAPYAPADVLYQNQMQPYEVLKSRLPTHRKPILTEKPLRLSPACLDAMTAAHRSFSQQTAGVEKAASELFRRVERLREEMHDQVKQMAALAERLQRLREDSEETKNALIKKRIEASEQRQKDLVQRYEQLRRKAARIGASKQELSLKETGWVEEIHSLSANAGVEPDDNSDPALKDRFDTVSNLTKELLEQGQAIVSNLEKEKSRAGPLKPGLQRTDSNSSHRSSVSNSMSMSVSSRLQKERIADVMSMVDREAAIIEAVTSRLGRLNMAYQ